MKYLLLIGVLFLGGCSYSTPGHYKNFYVKSVGNGYRVCVPIWAGSDDCVSKIFSNPTEAISLVHKLDEAMKGSWPDDISTQ